MRRYSLILFLWMICIYQNGYAQQPANSNFAFRGKIIGKGKPFPDKISLRWNVDNYQVFAKLALDGVFIDRLIIGKNNKAEGSWQRVSIDTVKAKPLKAFSAAAARKDTASLIIAQMLYGKSTYPQTTNLLEKIKTQNDERQNKHLISSLYAAISPDAAFLAGLAFEDKMTIDTAKKYVYRIYPSGKSKRVGTLDTGFVYVLGRDLKADEKYRGLKTEKGDRVVTLKWPKESNVFAGYYIERADDKKNFKRVNKNIYLPLVDTIAANKFLSYTDSVPNYKKVYYRLKGINAFGEIKTFADTVMGFAVDQTAPESPNLTFERKENTVTFKWTANKEKDLKGYFLVQGNGISNADSVLNKQILSSTQTTYQFNLNPDFSAGYYRVLLADTAGNSNYSNPVYIFNPDTIPPQAPVGLKAKIDSLGNIDLSWPNDKKETVLRGYKIFIANQLDHEFTAISGIVPDTTFKFKTTLKTLTKNLYVKIAAVDASYNHSLLSVAIKVNRPDTIAPQRPVFLGYTNSNGKISIKWSADNGNDFHHFQVYRKLASDSSWKMLIQTRNTTYTDSLLNSGKAYEYAVKTADSSGLYSGFSMPLHVKTSIVNRPTQVNFTASFDTAGQKVNLSWQKPVEPVSFYLLYKNSGKGLSMYKSFQNTQTTFIESSASFDPTLYGLKIVYADKTESEIVKLK